MLDENPQFMLIAPKLWLIPNPIWFNVIEPEDQKKLSKSNECWMHKRY